MLANFANLLCQSSLHLRIPSDQRHENQQLHNGKSVVIPHIKLAMKKKKFRIE